ncbi:hypothetical protein [Methylophilus sp. YYY-1]|uniref:hypothetical protein n=1 Tax=Methylophilus sp. YYY-1 TaxID=2682087 RepID=UPI0023B31C82|nr:hypothetical protein [Methylophilus sp. YYY-1]MDF0377707.1 hypothetical protein [Methylophilus sp. YYY-1]
MDTKIVYNYSPEAPHVYTGPQQCYKTSLDQDTWHWTGLALENEPPATAANQIAAANADFTDWVVIADFVGFKYWLADGSEHVIHDYGFSPPADALSEKPVTSPTQEQLITQFTADIQDRLNSFARTRNYDNCLSCCTYAGSVVEKFATEAAYMISRRDAHWQLAYEILADVNAGSRPIPSKEDLFNELGPLEWPN